MLIHDFVLKNTIKHYIRMNTGCGYNCGLKICDLIQYNYH